ncbi:YndJ family protein [Streptomyces sp. MST-110588]|uniref:YndJ family protein n=1 Tax=Streptomyces sp. MST-110588 TaxID=2833628 RepID=UPI001F5D727B|nr:YndJ family protein [Streptomyces sp. MST-110588]UNO43153.1 YndJ family protein [Streptomyces sp. MST-110588]
MTVLVNLIVMLGMFAVVPMGLALIDGPRPGPLRRVRRIWPLAAVAGSTALWLPRGPLAATLAGAYAAATLLLALHAPYRLIRTRSLAPREIAVLTALVTPAVAGTALVAERAGHRLCGFDLRILSLTVPHFHFAGFAAALTAGLVCHATGRRSGRLAALSVPAGTLLVLLGYFVDDWAELAGALVLTAGMWLVGLLTWRDVRGTVPDRTTRALLGVSAAVLVATMLLALSWALGEATGLPHPTLGWMAATHGLGNALGFALCALLAWGRIQHSAGRPSAGPDHTPPTAPAPGSATAPTPGSAPKGRTAA